MFARLAGAVALAVALIGRHGRLLPRIEAIERQLGPAPAHDGDRTTHRLPVGVPAPPFAVTDRDGHWFPLDETRAPPDGRSCCLLRPRLRPVSSPAPPA